MKYTEDKAVSMIKRNRGKVGLKTIRCTTPGIKVLGAIDYLVKRHKYTWSRR